MGTLIVQRRTRDITGEWQEHGKSACYRLDRRKGRWLAFVKTWDEDRRSYAPLSERSGTSRSVIGSYDSADDAKAAAITLLAILDVPHVCDLGDIDKARKIRAQLES